MALSPMTTTFTPQANGGMFGINAYGPGYIEVNGVRHETAIQLHPESGPSPRPGLTVSSISAECIREIASLAPELVLIGTGNRQIFLPPAVLAPLIQSRVGVECMALPAACRTFNLLAAEGRQVVALLVIDSTTT